MSAKPRGSSVKQSTSTRATWAAVLTLVTVACGGATSEPDPEPAGGGAPTGASSGSPTGVSGGSSTGAPNYPAGHPCHKAWCGNYIELPDGTALPARTEDGGAADAGPTGKLKGCFCGNG